MWGENIGMARATPRTSRACSVRFPHFGNCICRLCGVSCLARGIGWGRIGFCNSLGRCGELHSSLVLAGGCHAGARLGALESRMGVLIAIVPLAALIFLRGCAASVALGAAGSLWSLVVVASVLHREYAASRAGATSGRIPPGVSGFRGVLRDLISSLLGASDGLMMMVVFTVLLTLAHIAGASEALGVAFAINVARIFVLPLKQFGMVGGCLVQQGAGAVSSYVGPMCAVLSIIAIALVACAMLDIPLSGVSPELFLLLALQMTIEPFGAFLSTMRKVVEGPSATVAGLAVCLVLVVAASCCLLYFGLFTAVNVWLVWVAGRIAFAVTTCVGLRSRELSPTSLAERELKSLRNLCREVNWARTDSSLRSA